MLNLRVLNIATFIPIAGYHPENDISLKIYADLRKDFGVQSEFVKPVNHIPFWLPYLKDSLKKRFHIITNKNYIDVNHNIKVHFFPSSFPLTNRLPFDSKFLKPLEYAYYKGRLEKVFKAYKPNIIHAHNVLPDGYYAMRLSRKFHIPYILTARGLFDDRYENILAKKVLEYAAKVTTPSHSLYTALKKYYNIELLPHGIDDYWYTTDPKVYSPEPIRLITVSRLLEMKNIQITLHAIAQLKHAGVTITLSIVGDGEYKNELKRLTESLGIAEQVKFYGWLTSSEIIALYKQHQIFIMLSYPETFGRAYFEAAAQGLLIIGVNDTGAHGHFSNEEAFFIEPSRDEVVRILQNLTPSVYSRKTSLAMQKISTYKNPVIINKYYNILNEIRDNFSKKSFTSF